MIPRLTPALVAAMLLCPAQLLAQDDPFFESSYIEGQLGLGLVLPQLGGPLTVLNNVGLGPFPAVTPVQSTSVLNFDAHAQAGLSFSVLNNDSARTILSLTGRNARDRTPLTSRLTEAFPGAFDDSYLLQAGQTHPVTIQTTELALRAIHEWQAGHPGLRWRAGLAAVSASQDFHAVPYFAGVATRTLNTRSSNHSLSAVLGASHYRRLENGLGLRLTGDLSAGYNRFRYNYRNVRASGILDQSNAVQDSGLVLGTTLAARLEKSLERGGILSVELGVNVLSGVGSGVETFLNPLGTRNTAIATKGTIATTHIAIGYAFKF